MGAKVRPASTSRASAADSQDIAAFVDTIPDAHRDGFSALRALIHELAPDADETVKWGSLQYSLNGSLFGLSVSKKSELNLYILTIGVIPSFAEELAGIAQSKCCLRFAAGAELPMATLSTVMQAAIARKR